VERESSGRRGCPLFTLGSSRTDRQEDCIGKDGAEGRTGSVHRYRRVIHAARCREPTPVCRSSGETLVQMNVGKWV
jgi:hypothetical protein